MLQVFAPMVATELGGIAADVNWQRELIGQQEHMGAT